MWDRGDCRLAVVALNPAAMAPITDTIRIAVAQLNSVVGDIDGNLKKARAARAPRRRPPAPTCWSCPSCSSPAIRRRIWCSSRPSRTPAAQAVEALAADTADGGPGVVVGTPWPRGGQVLQRRGAARRRQGRGAPLQGRAAQLRRLRRAARLRGRAAAGAGRLPRPPARPADLRGHLVRAGLASACPRPAPRC